MESSAVTTPDRTLEEETMSVQACACGFLLATPFTVSAGERLSVDSGQYYRSSWIQLDGAVAGRVRSRKRR